MGAKIMLLATLIGMVGCSLLVDFDEGSVMDADARIDAPSERSCTTSDMCESGEKCAVKLDSNSAPRLVCVMAGSVAEHGRCTEAVPDGPADDCARDHLCFRNTCYAVVAMCVGGEAARNIMVGAQTLQICVPRCDVLTAPACSVPLGCYLAADRSSTAGYCHAPGPIAFGQSCTKTAECAALQDCSVTSNICVALCPPGNNPFCINGNYGNMCVTIINDVVGECTP